MVCILGKVYSILEWCDVFFRGGGELVDYFEMQCNSDLVDFMKQRAEEDGYMYTHHTVLPPH